VARRYIVVATLWSHFMLSLVLQVEVECDVCGVDRVIGVGVGELVRCDMQRTFSSTISDVA
jgi:hypothetical protein